MTNYFESMNLKNVIFLGLSLMTYLVLFPSCENRSTRRPEGRPIVSQAFIEPVDTKPIVNIYIENSESMDGYVRGVTEFEQAIYNFLTEISISGFSDSLNLYYINNKILPHPPDVSNFIEMLEPSTFRAKGGDRGMTDVSNLLESVLSETDENEVAVLVYDGIFSPGSGIDAVQYLINQQISIKGIMAEYIEERPNTAVIIYQLSSQFNGYYFNRVDARTWISTYRPFYIWIIGDLEHLSDLISKVPESRFKGSGIQNRFTITSGNRNISYALRLGSGNFNLDRTNPKNTMNNLRRDRRSGLARFTIDATLNGFLLKNDYLLDTANYVVSNNDFSFSVAPSARQALGYSHAITLSANQVHKGPVSIRLKKQVPSWVEVMNDNYGNEPIPGQTFGIKQQILGVFEAFTLRQNYYSTITININ